MEMTGTTGRIEKPCTECGRTFAEPGRGECQLCHAVLLGKAVVASGWGQGEYSQFIGLLRESKTLWQFVAESREHGAHTCVRVGGQLVRIAHIAGVPEGEFLRALCDRLHRDELEISALAKTPGGLDGWNKRCAAAFGEASARLRDKGRKTLKPVTY